MYILGKIFSHPQPIVDPKMDKYSRLSNWVGTVKVIVGIVAASFAFIAAFLTAIYAIPVVKRFIEQVLTPALLSIPRFSLEAFRGVFMVFTMLDIVHRCLEIKRKRANANLIISS
ncbi:MAG: hypothetical protein WCP39_04120 [Chlamydiota bacterium]